MLQFVQSSPSTGNVNMDMTVLERQKATLHRLYSHQHQINQDNDHVSLHSLMNVDHEHSVLSHCSWKPVNPDRQTLPYPEMDSPSSLQTNHQRSFSVVSNSNNSSTTLPQCNSSLANRQVNDSCSAKKRKAEFDIEDENKDDAEEMGEERSEITTKADRETSTNNSSKVSEVQKPDYIHVRARRGQATDSHSLAERARREKISKKMKCLQDLVPGCNKVTGKAGMLDEIINYVQSLQKQVEFLSMKLATVNPRLDFSIDNFFSKEIPSYASLPAVATQLEATNATCYPYNSMHQGTSNHGVNVAIDQSQMLPQKLGSSSALIPEAFLPQLQLSGWDPDLTSLFNAGFH